MHHSLGHFVDGAVAARRHHQVGAVGYVLARDGSRGLGTRSGCNNDVVAVFLQDFHRAMDQRTAIPSEFSRTGIVDQDSLPVGCYGVISGILVKL
jgi:hypothetical protein